MKKYTIIASGALGVMAAACNGAGADGNSAPAWLETDSVAAIEARIAADFTLSREELAERLSEKYEGIQASDLDSLTARHYLEAKIIDGELRFHRKAPGNFGLLDPRFNGGTPPRGARASAARISYVDSVLAWRRGTMPDGGAHEVTYSFTVDVPYHKAIAGDTLRVWMPLPVESARQYGVEILRSTPAHYITSDGRSEHNTIYFEGPAPAAKGDTARFGYTARFVTTGAYVSAADIERSLEPYDRTSPDYERYTRLPDGPHIVRLDSLASVIVGKETNPFRQSELVYDYIINRFPWAGAREYSTLSCIPEYVQREGHGDCGQVSLLYISLMRTLGVPARWESGWMLHPGEKNLHDWAEVYFEGVGWLPVDVSFGRYTGASDPEARTFYSHGIDAHRFATNRGVGDTLYPPKRFVRSETVDFQLGEVETAKGNLYYPAWDSHMELIEVKPVETVKCRN